jgi:hypothetical protein
LKRPPLPEQTVREWLVSSGFALVEGGRVKPTAVGLEVASVLDQLG